MFQYLAKKYYELQQPINLNQSSKPIESARRKHPVDPVRWIADTCECLACNQSREHQKAIHAQTEKSKQEYSQTKKTHQQFSRADAQEKKSIQNLKAFQDREFECYLRNHDSIIRDRLTSV